MNTSEGKARREGGWERGPTWRQAENRAPPQAVRAPHSPKPCGKVRSRVFAGSHQLLKNPNLRQGAARSSEKTFVPLGALGRCAHKKQAG